MPELPNAKLHCHPAKEIGYQGAAAWERGQGSESCRTVLAVGPQPQYA